MKLGLESLLLDEKKIGHLKNQRVGLVAHPASIDRQCRHSLDLLKQQLNVTCAFGPQHGVKGDKQYNMEETYDEFSDEYQIPIFSLYGEVRRPTDSMMQTFDVLLFDLQDVGCRIFTYLATMIYLLEACAQHKKSIWILDRPNPAGRNIEGSLLQKDWFSFVGAAPTVMRHGLTLGELALWYAKRFNLDLDVQVVKMTDYYPTKGRYGWPMDQIPWVNPSPNIPRLSCVPTYNGTVMLEGTNLSEGRGTTVPLEIFGAPQFPAKKIIKWLDNYHPGLTSGTLLRPCFFEPTFNKHQNKLCEGIQIHIDHSDYDPKLYQPYRLMAAIFKAIRTIEPEYDLWAYFHYEYEKDRTPIDLISGSTFLREWVDDSESDWQEMENYLLQDEAAWKEEIQPFLLY